MTSIEVTREGPPPPPHERRRRRRRRRLLALLTVGFVLAAVVAALALSDPGGGDTPDTTGTSGEREPSGAPEPSLDRPDVAQLAGIDAIFARLLIEVDASERVMMGFQRELAESLAAPSDGATPLLEEIRTTAEDRRDELLEVRAGLGEPLEDPRAEAVRTRYLRHLDAWSSYLRALVRDPALLTDEAASAPYDVEINATAADFARELEDQLPASTARSVRAFAEAILERGFRSQGTAEV